MALGCGKDFSLLTNYGIIGSSCRELLDSTKQPASYDSRFTRKHEKLDR
jgi:hypothetical protein